jgi:hypothetical protein
MLQDTVKRQPFRTDGGRTVFGGGGIVPDLELKQDSATAVERDFFRALAKDLGKWESELLRFAVEYGRNTPGLTPDFQVTPAMRNTLFERSPAPGSGDARPVRRGAALRGPAAGERHRPGAVRRCRGGPAQRRHRPRAAGGAAAGEDLAHAGGALPRGRSGAQQAARDGQPEIKSGGR